MYIGGAMKNNLRSVRKHKGYSLRKVADEIGMSFQSLSHYEIGIRVPTITLLSKLSKFYEVSIDVLYPQDTSSFSYTDDVTYASLVVSELSHQNAILGNIEIMIYSKIGDLDLAIHKCDVIGKDYYHRTSKNTDLVFGYLIKTKEYIPAFTRGDVLLFEKCKIDAPLNLLKNKDILIVLNNEENKLFRFLKSKQSYHLVSMNDDAIFTVTSLRDAGIIGVLRELRRPFGQ